MTILCLFFNFLGQWTFHRTEIEVCLYVFTISDWLAAVKIKKNAENVKFKVRCSRFLYTLVITDKEKAEKLKQSLPPGELSCTWYAWFHNCWWMISYVGAVKCQLLWVPESWEFDHQLLFAFITFFYSMCVCFEMSELLIASPFMWYMYCNTIIFFFFQVFK